MKILYSLDQSCLSYVTARNAVKVGSLGSVDFAEWAGPKCGENIPSLEWIHLYPREPNTEWNGTIPDRS